MKKLRLLLWEDCNRKCDGCCNKDYDLSYLDVEKDFSQYDEIFLTGGEPMLNPKLVNDIILELGGITKAKIFMYTAKVDDYDYMFHLSCLLDGITVTLHEQSDVGHFRQLIKKYPFHGSMRLNVFKDIDISGMDLSKWQVKDNIEWIKNAPLPKNEVFKRY